MSSPEASVSPRDLRRYAADVDDLLLDLPWRRRRGLIAELRRHLEEDPRRVRDESPAEYAAELRETETVVPAGLFSGLRSFWPSPVEWCESIVRGAAVSLVVWALCAFAGPASQSVAGDPSPDSWSTMHGSAFDSIWPSPTFRGSQRDGLVAFV